MKRQVSVVELRKNLSQILGAAYYQGEATLVTHHGRPYAWVVSPQDADLLAEAKRRGYGTLR